MLIFVGCDMCSQGKFLISKAYTVNRAFLLRVKITQILYAVHFVRDEKR